MTLFDCDHARSPLDAHFPRVFDESCPFSTVQYLYVLPGLGLRSLERSLSDALF